jgi:hypothetical protein
LSVRPYKRIVGLREDHELRQVGLGDRDRAGRAQRRDIGIVSAFDDIAARRQAECRCRAGKIETFLDSDRQAGERPQFLATRQGLVDVRRGFARALKEVDGDGVEPPVDGLEPSNEVFDGFAGRQIAGGDATGDLARREVLQLTRARRRCGGRNVSERHDLSPETAHRAYGTAQRRFIPAICQFADAAQIGAQRR